MSNVFFMLGLGTARKLRLSVFAPVNSAVYRSTLCLSASQCLGIGSKIDCPEWNQHGDSGGQKSMPKSCQKLSLQQPSSNETKKKRSKMFMIGDKTLLPAESASEEEDSLLLL